MSRPISCAHYLRLEQSSDARYLRLSARSLRLTRDHRVRRTIIATHCDISLFQVAGRRFEGIDKASAPGGMTAFDCASDRSSLRVATVRSWIMIAGDPSGAVQALDGLADGGDGLDLAPGQAGGREVVIIQGDPGVERGGVHAAMLRRGGLATGQRRPAQRPGVAPFQPLARVIITNIHPSATNPPQFVTHPNNLP
jgi:hypothetical protein